MTRTTRKLLDELCERAGKLYRDRDAIGMRAALSNSAKSRERTTREYESNDAEILALGLAIGQAAERAAFEEMVAATKRSTRKRRPVAGKKGTKRPANSVKEQGEDV